MRYRSDSRLAGGGVLLSVPLLSVLQACGPSYLDRPLECSEIRKLCFRGVQLDEVATRERFGNNGYQAILKYRNDF